MRKWLVWVGGGVFVVLLLAAWQLGLLTSPPEEANLADAIAAEEGNDISTQSPTTSTSDTTLAGEATTAAPTTSIDHSSTTEATPQELSEAGDLDGTWVIKVSDGTFAGYRIDEILSGVDFTAVGRSREVQGHLVAGGNTIETVEVTVDLWGLTSDSRIRDSQLKSQALETQRFRYATFVLTEAIVIEDLPAEGVEATFDVVGELTVHGVTNEVTMALQATTANGLLFVVGGTEVSLADYDIDTPTAPAVAGVSDVATMELSLVFAP